MGKLYLVPTPVGNLGDITLRALELLKTADLVLAEDTRTTGMLLKHYDIKARLQSHHKFNEHQTAEAVAERLAASDETVVLVSDAGTPGISDPGFMLVRACVAREVEVQCLPGATAFVPALVSSGLPCERFAFEGFLPQKKGRATRLAALAEEPRTMIIFVSHDTATTEIRPLSLPVALQSCRKACREISKLHEECVRGTLEEVAAHFEANEPRGEFVLIVEGRGKA